MTNGQRLFTISLGAALMLACVPAPAQPAEPRPVAPAAPSAAAPAEPKSGGLLQWAPIKPGQTLHPHRGGSTDITRHAGPGYEPLLTFNYQPGKDYRATFEVVPWLAQSWSQRDDLTYVFNLRKGVKWHDGINLAAEDVAFTYNWLRKEKLPASSSLARADVIEAVDPLTLKITLKALTPDFQQELADKNLLIVARHVVERGDDLNKVLIGTGPFKIRSFNSGVETLWERNDGYWLADRPYIRGVRQVWGLEDSAMIAAFVAGENDLLAAADPTQLETVRRARPDAGVFNIAADNGIGVYLKLDRPPFNDVRVRRAIQLAVDRQAINQVLAQGKGVFVTPGVWPGREGWAIPQEELRRMTGFRSPKDPDLAEARRLLAEAGYPEGLSFDIIFNAGGNYPKLIVETLPSQLKAIGVTANLKPLESGVYNDADLRTGDWEAGNINTTVDSQFGKLFARFHSKSPNNHQGLNDPRLDSLIDATLTGKDEGARKRLARQLQEYFLEQVYFIPTVELVSAHVWLPWVRDYAHPGGSQMHLPSVTLSRMWLDTDAMPAGRR